MDKDITIGNPTLNTGDSFEVKYRLLPNGAWQDFGLVNTNSFTITGLVDGDYQIEIGYVFADGHQCPPTTTTFTVDSNPPVITCDCLNLTGVFVNVGCDQIITINATITTPLPDNCGIRVTYSSGGSSDSVINYTNATIPNPLVIPIPSSTNVNLKVEILCCGTEQWLTCYNAPIVNVTNCNCVSAPVITNETITYNPDSTKTYCVTFTGSNPNINPYTIVFYPTVGNPLSYNQTVPSPGTYCFQIPENVYPSRGKWLCIVSNPCGQDTGNGL